MDEQYYSRQDVAKRLGVSIDTIQRAIKKGNLVDVRIGINGRTSRISESSVQNYIFLRTGQVPGEISA